MKKPAVVKVAAHTRKPPAPPAKPTAIVAPVVPPIDQIQPQTGMTPNIPTPRLSAIIRGGAAAMRGTPPMPKPVVVAEKVSAKRSKR